MVKREEEISKQINRFIDCGKCGELNKDSNVIDFKNRYYLRNNYQGRLIIIIKKVTFLAIPNYFSIFLDTEKKDKRKEGKKEKEERRRFAKDCTLWITLLCCCCYFERN